MSTHEHSTEIPSIPPVDPHETIRDRDDEFEKIRGEDIAPGKQEVLRKLEEDENERGCCD